MSPDGNTLSSSTLSRNIDRAIQQFIKLPEQEFDQKVRTVAPHTRKAVARGSSESSTAALHCPPKSWRSAENNLS